MIINWHGQSCFEISTNQGNNNPVKIVIDPFEEQYVGLKLPRNLGADIVLVTHEHKDHNNIKRVSGSPFVAQGPGEYDVKAVYIEGISAFHDSSQGKERGDTTIYTIEAEEMRLCHLGDLGQKELLPEQLERIGEVDILMIPVGGIYTISAKEAVKIMSQIEPKVILPMHYKIPGLNIQLEPLDNFLKAVGIKKLESLPKFSIKAKGLPIEEVKIVALQV